ncbi:MAG: 3-phosphoserine/phosphohydroxythreonine transaminase [Deltaproteobacteria bacterium]|nr:3-phosphoserine/phosphohydroxythreonine transaminase [Deltaproteobacteria bacterium]
MARIHNFNAGPAALPLPVLERAQREFVDFEGTGMSILEHSHRGKAYDGVHNEAIALLRELMGISDDYHVLFIQGGASLQFCMLPMNLVPKGGSGDYVLTGTWAKKALQEAERLGVGRLAGTSEKDGVYPRIPKQADLDLDPKAAYVHITTNNTIAGTQYHDFPDTGSVPLVADMSSDIMWRPIDVSKFGMLYAGAQKNIGPSGVAVVVVRKDLVDGARTDLPNFLRYSTFASKNSLYNTANTFAIYMIRNVCAYLKELGGLGKVEENNRAKGKLLYDMIEGNPGFYKCPIELESRSYMNVVFRLPSEDLEKKFIADGLEAGLNGLKGHRSVGGCRASIYNAVPMAAVEALVKFMGEFQKANS